MKTSELKQSKYLKKEDCGADGILVTITGLKQENVAMDNKPEDLKWLISFRECKPMVLNGTNTALIEKALGTDETDDWIGKQIVLFNDENVSFGGEIVGGIRCDVVRTKRYHAKKNGAAPVKASRPHVDDGSIEAMADDIPF